MDNSSSDTRGLQSLSLQETQLILLAGYGLTDKEIAKSLKISVGAVIALWSRVSEKLGTSSRISAVTAMYSTVARLDSQLAEPEAGRTDFEGMLGRLSETRLIVNQSHLVLSCSPKAAALLGLRPGLALSASPDSEVSFLDSHGRTLGGRELPWVRAMQENERVRGFPLTISRQGKTEDFLLDCNAIDDPILSRVAVLDLRTAGNE